MIVCPPPALGCANDTCHVRLGSGNRLVHLVAVGALGDQVVEAGDDTWDRAGWAIRAGPGHR